MSIADAHTIVSGAIVGDMPASGISGRGGRPDRHSLVNFGLGKKIFSSLSLLGGIGVFASASLAGMALTTWDLSALSFLKWGEPLMGIRARSPQWFWGVFAAHVVALLVVVFTSNILFHRVSLPRAARRALTFVTLVFGALDVASWLLLPYLDVAQYVLGPFIAVAFACLSYLAGRPLHDMWIFTRWRGSSGERKRVVFVGGGFAGLYAAMGLDKTLGYHRDLEITVVDKRNYFLFPPLLPSVAAGAIETRQVTYPFRRIFEATNVVFRKETVLSIDTEKKCIRSRIDIDNDPETGEIRVVQCETPYDVLVLAPGSETNTFGTKGVAEHAFFMRELGDATSVRNHIIDCFERAAREGSEARRKELLRFVIVGAGPTGVELASEVRDLVAHVLFNRYPEVSTDDVEVILVQSAPQILPGWNDAIVTRTRKQLEALRIQVLTNKRVTAVDAFCVSLGDGQRIETRTCVWCAGVKPSGLLAQTKLPRDKSGRIPIDPDLRVPGHPDVLVLGDAAHFVDKGKPLPPLGQVAFQQGAHAAHTISALLRGKSTKPFRYFNFGSLVSVGEHFAAIELLGIRLSGFVAWIIWRTLYLMKLVGFGNKLRVVLDWTLDLLIERSISQIAVNRQDLRADEAEKTVSPGA